MLRPSTWCLLAVCLTGCVDIVGPRPIDPLPEPVDAGLDLPVAADVAPSPDLPDLTPPDLGADLSDVTPPLTANAGPDVVADVGEFVSLDGSGSTGAVSYQWDFGNGTGWDAPRATSGANVAYDEAGRFEAVLTVFDAEGNRESASKRVLVTEPVRHVPAQSSTVVSFGTRAAVVSADSNEVLLIERTRTGFSVYERYPTDRLPQTLATWDDGHWLVVPCRDDGTILYLRTNRTGEQRRVFLPLSAQPFGVVESQGKIYVTLQATGQLVEIEDRGGVPTVSQTVDVIEDARDIATLPDGRLLVSRWRSTATEAQIAVVSPDLQTVEMISLAASPGDGASDVIAGVPSYLGAVAVSPTMIDAAVPSLLANTGQGTFLNGQSLSSDRTLRAATSFVTLSAMSEAVERRIQWMGRGFASAALFSPRGDYLYIAMRGNQTIERLDMLAPGPAGRLDSVGHALEGLALSADGRWLYVDAAMSRELVIYDTSAFEANAPADRIVIPTAETLDAEVFRGKQLFNDASDPRLAAGGYLACAHCHLGGDSDGRVWDLTEFGEGLRNTPSLLGRSGAGDGPLHWSARADEVQDIESDIREAFGGLGLMDDLAYGTGTRSDPLGDAKAGLSRDLDALAAYVSSLDRVLPSPYRTASGGLTPEASAGELLFASQGCSGCHSGPRFTDSGFELPGVPVIHDVGTLTAGSGSRLAGPLLGLDTPTLRGVWRTAPYLHDGSAATLEDVLTSRNIGDAHGTTSTLTPSETAALVAYLQSLDYR